MIRLRQAIGQAKCFDQKTLWAVFGRAQFGAEANAGMKAAEFGVDGHGFVFSGARRLMLLIEDQRQRQLNLIGPGLAMKKG